MSLLLDDLTQRITALIEQNRPIVSAYSDEDGERRFWRIDDFAQVPVVAPICGIPVRLAGLH